MPKFQLLHMNKPKWQWGRALRGAISIALPFMAGLMFDDIMTGMWVGMGCLMMITGEGEGTYREIYQAMFLSALIGSFGYFAGYLNLLPWNFLVIVMIFIGGIAGILSIKSRTLSIGMLQVLLLASIAIGVPSIGSFWVPAILYLVGVTIYALMLSVEIFIHNDISFVHKKETEATNLIKQHLVLQSSARFIQNISYLQWCQAFSLAICLGIAYSIHWVDDNKHWFWIPLTVGLIMKPDLGSIRDRSIQRILGTLIGVMIGAIILILVPKNIVFIMVMSILAGILPWAMKSSYILQAIFLTPLILMLINIIQPGAADFNYAIERLEDTIVGSLIVLLFGYLPLNFLYKKGVFQ
ncbi:FUSC family protein [Providencia rettgeri]|uniref:FUSC family protein n=1 Tax=Providencia rettgeri TaxID=587 RepID=UPI0001C3470C|nr:FUSC family protein [Providencia rettgeri]QXA58869.1 FUSC family protein [Providencia rettgeri]